MTVFVKDWIKLSELKVRVNGGATSIANFQPKSSISKGMNTATLTPPLPGKSTPKEILSAKKSQSNLTKPIVESEPKQYIVEGRKESALFGI